MVFPDYIAHTREFDDSTQPLQEHLRQSARLAKEAAQETSVANLGPLAEAAGLLHDMGKYTQAFQRHIHLKDNSKVPHAAVGAQLAVKLYGPMLGKVLAYCICGHHGGLPDDIVQGEAEGGGSCLQERLTDTVCARLLQEALPASAAEVTLPAKLAAPRIKDSEHRGFALSLLTRMLYSTLVDADFMDTEAFCQPSSAALREKAPILADVAQRFFDYYERRYSPAVGEGINQWRAQVYRQCVQAAALPPGVFRLCVPTGGGKTLSSLAFALKHAQKYSLRRIIYAIPYTSIIEQNADVFREALGNDAVLEHHSNLDPKDEDTEDLGKEERMRRLASENWDSPVVVTTNVQFFESLFANKPSRCRKLHRIARSVIVLDEAQMIPTEFLRPCLAALQCLVRDYGCTVVICTATQPAFDDLWPEPQPITPIIGDVPALFQAFRRVQVQPMDGTLNHDELAQRLCGQTQVLCIVNTRRAAQNIYEGLPVEGRFHLSTLMCAQHRSDVLRVIRQRLLDGLPCRVVSTQLIEAGVDVDFPVVYRAAAGMDSIAQAAGRCNREGRRGLCTVYVYQPAEGTPRGPQHRAASIGWALLKRYPDAMGSQAIGEYFYELYHLIGKEQLDREGILSMLNPKNGLIYPFAEAAQRFHFIDTPTINVLIPYDERCRAWLVQAEQSNYPANSMRRLQRYMVGVYPQQLNELQDRGWLKQGKLPCLQLNIAEQSFHEVYSPETGLRVAADLSLWDI